MGHMQVCNPLQRDNHSNTQFFTGRMPILLPKQQRQGTEGNKNNQQQQQQRQRPFNGL